MWVRYVEPSLVEQHAKNQWSKIWGDQTNSIMRSQSRSKDFA